MDSQRKNIQTCLNRMNYKIESYLLLNGKLQNIKVYYLIFNKIKKTSYIFL